jgi:hypothetical protein
MSAALILVGSALLVVVVPPRGLWQPIVAVLGEGNPRGVDPGVGRRGSVNSSSLRPRGMGGVVAVRAVVAVMPSQVPTRMVKVRRGHHSVVPHRRWPYETSNTSPESGAGVARTVGNRNYLVDPRCPGNGHQPGSCKIAGSAHSRNRLASLSPTTLLWHRRTPTINTRIHATPHRPAGRQCEIWAHIDAFSLHTFTWKAARSRSMPWPGAHTQHQRTRPAHHSQLDGAVPARRAADARRSTSFRWHGGGSMTRRPGVVTAQSLLARRRRRPRRQRPHGRQR